VVETSNFGDVERKKITESNRDENELGTNLKEEEEEEKKDDDDDDFETNSSNCDDINEIESSDNFKVLVESNPPSQSLAQASACAPCSNVVNKIGFTTV